MAKKEVTNEVILGAIVSLDKRVGSLDDRMGSLEGKVVSLGERMDSSDKRLGSVEKTNQALLRAVVSIEERIGNLPTRVEMEWAIEKAKEEILEEVRPMSAAVDKDAMTIISHERRIARVEKHLAISNH